MSPLLTVNEVAERLRVSAKTLSRWRTLGQGPHFLKLGGGIKYRESDLEDWIENRGRTATRSGTAANADIKKGAR